MSVEFDENFPPTKSPRAEWLKSTDRINSDLERRAIGGIAAIVLACGTGAVLATIAFVRIVEQFAGN